MEAGIMAANRRRKRRLRFQGSSENGKRKKHTPIGMDHTGNKDQSCRNEPKKARNKMGEE
jgi:hypothetical protein